MEINVLTFFASFHFFFFKNMEVEKAIFDITDQWNVVLGAKLCGILNLPINDLRNKIEYMVKKFDDTDLGNVMNNGLQAYMTMSPDQLNLMEESTSLLLLTFSNSKQFCDIFNRLFMTSYKLLHISWNDQEQSTNVKALHTDNLNKEVKLDPKQELHYNFFEFSNKFLQKTLSEPEYTIDKINPEIIYLLFNYIHFNQPNMIRKSAGNILGLLSSSYTLLQLIVNRFWYEFNQCKKEDEFRNFSAVIDGISTLRFELNPIEFAVSTFTFINTFIENEKKIERGVLRIKFITAMENIFVRVTKTLDDDHPKYYDMLESVWNIAVRWSSKSKHTLFCYTFLVHVLENTIDIFYNQHVKELCTFLCKFSKDGDVEGLKLLATFINQIPQKYYEANPAEYKTMMSKDVIPIIFGGSDSKRTLRFVYEDQYDSVLSIIQDVGRKDPSVLVDIFVTILQDEEFTDDHKFVRMVCLRCLGTLCLDVPEKMYQYSDRFSPLIDPLLLQLNPNFLHEQQHAIRTYPAIHSKDEAQNEIISQIIFFLAIGTEPFANDAKVSFRTFVEDVVDPEFCGMTPITYINNLIQNIESSTAADSALFMNYLKSIIVSYTVNLSKCSDVDGYVYKFIQEWEKMRMNLDCLLTMLLLHPQEDIAQAACELVDVLNAKEILDFDKRCKYNQNNLCTFLASVNTKDIMGKAKEFIQFTPDFAKLFFEKLLSKFEMRRKQTNAPHALKIVKFLLLIAQNNDECFAKLLNMIFSLWVENPQSPEIRAGIDGLNFDLVYTFSDSFFKFKESSKTDLSKQMISCMESISLREQFNQIKEDNALLNIFELFIIGFLGVKVENDKSYFTACERALGVFIRFLKIDITKLDKIFNTQMLVDTLFSFIINHMKFEYIDNIDQQFPKTLMQMSKVIFSYFRIDITLFEKLTASFLEFTQAHATNEGAITSLVAALTELLKNNPSLLHSYVAQTYTSFDLYNSNFILAIANCFILRKDFLKEYENAAALILFVTIMHVSSSQSNSRQAAHKLICLILSSDIFAYEAPRSLFMSTSSQSTSGFMTQADQFMFFVSETISPAVSFGCFSIFSQDISRIPYRQNVLLATFRYLIPGMMKECDVSQFVRAMLNLAAFCDQTKSSTAQEIAILWELALNSLKQYNKADPSELSKIIFDYGVSQRALTTPQTQASIQGLCSLFKVFPYETGEFIVSHFEKYNRTVPDSAEKFLEFLESEHIDLIPSTSEILAANTLSQILLLIPTFDLFEKVFRKKVLLIFFFSMFNYHRQELQIGAYRPLLDVLLDTALFRFNNDRVNITNNLKLLQKYSLLKIATSLEEQFSITTVPSRRKFAGDHETIQKVLQMMKQFDPDFKDQFYNLVLANAFLAAPGERAIEPLVMMISMKDTFKTKTIYFMLLFTLYAIKNNRSDLMDTLVELIQSRLLNCSSEDLYREAVPVIITFLAYVRNGKADPFNYHMMKMISGVCDRVVQHDKAEEIGKELIGFFDQFGGDEYLASLFYSYMQMHENLNSISSETVIEVLFKLSDVISMDSERTENLCLLVGLLFDALRVNTTKIECREILSGMDYDIQPFCEFLTGTFSTKRKQLFVIAFFIYAYRNLKFMNPSKDSIVVSMLALFMANPQLDVDTDIYNKTLKFAKLISFSSTEEGMKSGAQLFTFLIEHIKYTPPPEIIRISKMGLKLSKLPDFKAMKESKHRRKDSNKVTHRASADTTSLDKVNKEQQQRKTFIAQAHKQGRVVNQTDFPQGTLFTLGVTQEVSIIDIMSDYIVDKAKII